MRKTGVEAPHGITLYVFWVLGTWCVFSKQIESRFQYKLFSENSYNSICSMVPILLEQHPDLQFCVIMVDVVFLMYEIVMLQRPATYQSEFLAR